VNEIPPLDAAVLPAGVRARFVEGVNGLRMHVLEAGEAGRPLVLLLHGFPELAYSWRKVMRPLADAGYHVVAPDQRGYGRTTGWDGAYGGDLPSFRLLNLVRDQLGLIHALGHSHVELVAGHDFGQPVAAWASLVRPDVFRRTALMAAPFAGPPSLPGGRVWADDPIHAQLAALPRPRRHYMAYYSTPQANADMLEAPQGLAAFLRAYYHHKSADWAGNRPFELAGWRAEELAKLPTYYVMDLGRTMPETAAEAMPSPAEVAACRWLTDAELAVYAGEYARTGFQGGLQWYRCLADGVLAEELELFAGRRIETPAVFMAGASDWCYRQVPGAYDRMAKAGVANLAGSHIIPGAGHWLQQEQPQRVANILLDHLQRPL